MGWGISIDQDEDGYTQCSDANFETNAYDYQGYPPSSYDFIYEKVGEARSEVDWLRDEMGADAAHERCLEAFRGAKCAWDHMDEDEKNTIHREYVRDLKKQVRECKVDRVRQKEKLDQITFFEKQFGPELSKLDEEIAELEERLREKREAYKEKREPLAILEEELALIMAPARLKKELQKRLELEEAEWDR